MKINFKTKSIAIIGTGRVGTSLAQKLIKKKFNVKYLIDNSSGNLRNAGKLFGRKKLFPVLTTDQLEKSDIIIICTKDDEIRKIVKSIADVKIDISRKVIFHTSGSETSTVFGKLKISLKNTGSIHPIQTFSEIKKNSDKYFENIYITAEGGDKFHSFVKYFCREADAKLIRITPGKKQIYHLICVYVSNYLVSYFKSISEIGRYIGIPENKFLGIFAPLIETAYGNMKRKGFKMSLTGPIERGDVSSILKHKRILHKLDVHYDELYNLLGAEALKMSIEKKSINSKKSKIIEEILRK